MILVLENRRRVKRSPVLVDERSVIIHTRKSHGRVKIIACTMVCVSSNILIKINTVQLQ